MAKSKTPSPKLMVGAAQAADLPQLKKLVAAGGDLNASHRGYRGLHALIQTKPHARATVPSSQQIACFKWMLKNGADPELLGALPPARAILVAAIVGSQEYVDVLTKAGAKIDVFVSAALGDVASVTSAIASRFTVPTDRDAGGLTALQCAAASRMGREDAAVRHQLIEIATALLNAGAEPEARTQSWGHDVDAVYFAASAHHVEMFELLLRRGADPTRAMVPAIWNGGDRFESLANAALAFGADVNSTVSEGRPLLNDLIRWGQFTQALWLLKHGADPNREQNPEESHVEIHIGTESTNDVARTLATTVGWTALHQAASRGNARMVEALIAAGAEVYRIDHACRTPYDVANAAPLRALLRKARGIIHS